MQELKVEIQGLLDSLNEWKTSLTGKGHDYLTTLIIICGYIDSPSNYMKFNLTEVDIETHLKNRLEYLSNQNNISATLLVSGISTLLLNWLMPSSVTHIGMINAFEEQGELPASMKKLQDRHKSVDYHIACEIEYFNWLKISTTSLGADTLKSWQDLKILKNIKK